jgi:hypothetical protein
MLHERKVTRVGIYFMGELYYHVRLYPYVDEIVKVEAMGDCLEVYDRNGNSICTAEKTIF